MASDHRIHELNGLINMVAGDERVVELERFDVEDSWKLGCIARRLAAANSLAVAIRITRGAQVMFHAALPGACAHFDGWLARKASLVADHNSSSYLVALTEELHVLQMQRQMGGSSTVATGVPMTWSSIDHGGAVPIKVRGAGVVGSLAVSGLSQGEDHDLAAAALSEFAALEN